MAALIRSKNHAIDIEGPASLVWDAVGIEGETTFPVSGILLPPGSEDERAARNRKGRQFITVHREL